MHTQHTHNSNSMHCIDTLTCIHDLQRTQIKHTFYHVCQSRIHMKTEYPHGSLHPHTHTHTHTHTSTHTHPYPHYKLHTHTHTHTHTSNYTHTSNCTHTHTHF